MTLLGFVCWSLGCLGAGALLRHHHDHRAPR